MLDKLKNLKTSVVSRVSTARAGAAQSQQKHIVALDVGTEYIKALIGRVRSEDGGIDIVGMGRAHQQLSDMQSGAIADISSVVENCDRALSDAEQQAGLKIGRASCRERV